MRQRIDKQGCVRPRSQSEVDGDLPAEAVDLISSEQSAWSQQSAPGHWLECGDIGVGLIDTACHAFRSCTPVQQFQRRLHILGSSLQAQ